MPQVSNFMNADQEFPEIVRLSLGGYGLSHMGQEMGGRATVKPEICS
jgi:hypothetical protein